MPLSAYPTADLFVVQQRYAVPRELGAGFVASGTLMVGMQRVPAAVAPTGAGSTSFNASDTRIRLAIGCRT